MSPTPTPPTPEARLVVQASATRSPTTTPVNQSAATHGQKETQPMDIPDYLAAGVHVIATPDGRYHELWSRDPNYNAGPLAVAIYGEERTAAALAQIINTHKALLACRNALSELLCPGIGLNMDPLAEGRARDAINGATRS